MAMKTRVSWDGESANSGSMCGGEAEGGVLCAERKTSGNMAQERERWQTGVAMVQHICSGDCVGLEIRHTVSYHVLLGMNRDLLHTIASCVGAGSSGLSS